MKDKGVNKMAKSKVDLRKEEKSRRQSERADVKQMIKIMNRLDRKLKKSKNKGKK
jgi:hypothetical protein